jgi:hypothetical protein
MARKGYTAEQIINKLREAEVLISQGATTIETDLPPWTIPV